MRQSCVSPGLMPIVARCRPLIVGVPSSGPQALPFSSSPRARRRAAITARRRAASPAANDGSLGTSPRTMTRSRKPAVRGTSDAMPSTTIAPAMPLPTSYEESPCGCGWYQYSPGGWSGLIRTT